MGRKSLYHELIDYLSTWVCLLAAPLSGWRSLWLLTTPCHKILIRGDPMCALKEKRREGREGRKGGRKGGKEWDGGMGEWQGSVWCVWRSIGEGWRRVGGERRRLRERDGRWERGLELAGERDGWRENGRLYTRERGIQWRMWEKMKESRIVEDIRVVREG